MQPQLKLTRSPAAITSDLYTHVVPAVTREAAEKMAGVVVPGG